MNSTEQSGPRFDYGLNFYLELARQADGPVLDIACGTGRIMLPCLRLRLDVEGLDLYEGMLDRLRRKAAAEQIEPRLHRADMSDFRLPRRFALIMIPFNAFIHNMTADAQIRCLQLCREHLLPGGVLAFDTFFPGKEIVTTPDGTRVLEGEFAHRDTGLPVRLYDTRSFDRVAQIQHSRNEIEFLDSSRGHLRRIHVACGLVPHSLDEAPEERPQGPGLQSHLGPREVWFCRSARSSISCAMVKHSDRPPDHRRIGGQRNSLVPARSVQGAASPIRRPANRGR